MRQQRPTLHDVARLAGLSTSTVSRALTGARPVSPDIASRVQTAADQLGYRPDTVARSLRRQETQTLGLVVADITNPFFPLLVQAVEHETRRAGFALLLADAQNDADIEKQSVALLLDKRIDALLISPSHRFLSQAAIDAARRVVPVIQLDRVADESVGYVRVDQAAAVRLLVDHFLSRGRRHLAFIGSETSVSTSWERQQAFLDYAQAHDPAAVVRVLSGDFSVEWGRTAAKRLIEHWPEVDAIMCANDLIALGAQQMLGSLSIDLPRAVAISGFDDTLIASASRLTSVRQPVRELAAAAVTATIEAVGDGREIIAETLPPTLITRESTE